MTNSKLTKILKILWPDDHPYDCRSVYAVLDGARDAQIEPLVRSSGLAYECLYNEPLSQDLRAAATYVVELVRDAYFTEQLLQLGWGNNWGVFFIAYPPTDLAMVRHNCRKMNIVLSPSGRRMLFRYFDPRVLNTYLPSCSEDELESIFGDIEVIIAEEKNTAFLNHFQYNAKKIDVTTRSI